VNCRRRTLLRELAAESDKPWLLSIDQVQATLPPGRVMAAGGERR
jgi:hypothetical protein